MSTPTLYSAKPNIGLDFCFPNQEKLSSFSPLGEDVEIRDTANLYNIKGIKSVTGRNYILNQDI